MFAKALTPVAPVSQPPIFHKTKICRFYLAGTCNRPEDCSYAHSEAELKPMPDFSRTRICSSLRDNGFCNRGPSCKFAHTTGDLRARTSRHAKLLKDYKALVAQAPATTEPPVPPPPAPPSLPPAVDQQVQQQTQQQTQQQLLRQQLQQQLQQQQRQRQQQRQAQQTQLLRQAPAQPSGIEEVACKAGWDEDLDEEDDTDFPSMPWSRQSTDQPMEDGPEPEFLSEDDEWEAGSALEVRSEASDAHRPDDGAAITGGAAAGQPDELRALATACGLRFAVRRSFLAFDDGLDAPAAPLRRARSTGDLPVAGGLC